MPLIRRRRIPLPLEHMAQMAPAITAHNLGALHAERAIRMPRHGPGDAVEIRGPAATRFELVRGAVEGRGAGGAAVGARGGGVFVVGAGERGFGAAGAEDAELFCWFRWRALVVRFCGEREGGVVRGGGCFVDIIPLFKTARHSSSLFFTG